MLHLWPGGHEEHIAKICETFTGMSAGRGDVLRRALVKMAAKIAEVEKEFIASACAMGRDADSIARVWLLVS